MMWIKPLADRIVVRAAEKEEITKGGIIIPDTAKAKPMQGEILEVGIGRRDDTGKLIPPTVKKGDQILYGEYSGTEVTFEEEDYVIMRETDVFAVINKQEKNV